MSAVSRLKTFYSSVSALTSTTEINILEENDHSSTIYSTKKMTYVNAIVIIVVELILTIRRSTFSGMNLCVLSECGTYVL